MSEISEYLAIGGPMHGKLLTSYGGITKVPIPPNLVMPLEEHPPFFDPYYSTPSVTYRLQEYWFKTKQRRMKYLILSTLPRLKVLSLISEIENEEPESWENLREGVIKP